MKTILLWKIVKKPQRKCFIIYVFEHDFFHGCSTCYDKTLNFLDLVLVYKRKLKKKKKIKIFSTRSLFATKKTNAYKNHNIYPNNLELGLFISFMGTSRIEKKFSEKSTSIWCPLAGGANFFFKIHLF